MSENAHFLRLTLSSQAKTLLELDAELGGASRGTAELRQLLRLLEEGYGIGADWVGFDFSVVRGLAYYTGVVFEGFDRAGKLRAICGGGRYDKLFEAMGGQRAIPAVGFGFGDAVVTELLADKGLLPDLSGGAAEVVVFALAEELRPKAMAVAAGMRARGLRVDLVLEQARKTKAVMQRAGRDGAEVIVIVAPDEHSAGTAVVRQLKKGEQAAQPYADIAEYVRGLLRDGDGKTPL
jgi:histidyl-tRNA synthetase